MNTVKERSVEIDFDPLMEQSLDFLQNPYPVLKRYRQAAPVIWSAKGNHWIVSCMDEANFVLKNNSFGKRLELWKHPNPFMRVFTRFVGSQGFRNILRQDPPEHTRVRGLMSSAFVPSVIHGLEPEIQTITNKLIDRFENRNSADLISEFAFPLPITVIAELLGIPNSDRDQFKKWSTLITASLQGNVCPIKATKSFGASLELRKYLRKIIAEKLKTPAKDLLSSLAQISTADEGRLSEKELVANSILILIAGHETTVNLIGNGVYALLNHPTQLELLKSNPALIAPTVEEILRFDPPVQMVRRIAKEDMNVGGEQIKSGDAITVMIGSCNRDPKHFESPDEFKIERANKKHVSFGAGIHYCLGAELARTEARIAISTLLTRLPNLRLAETVMPYRGPFALRGLQYLKVDF